MKKYISIFCILATALSIPLAIQSQDWNEFRNKEAIVINGNYIPAFRDEGASVHELFLYAFNSVTNEWRQITFQIDQRDGDEDYFAAAYNDIIDGVDEIVFMAGDAGDTARAYQWIDDEDSRQYPRYQLQVTNPDDSLTQKYVYVYRSATLTASPDLPVYMNYVPASGSATDTVHAAGYTEGHTPRDGSGKGGGIPNTWKIPVVAGGNGLDILDRQKARVNGNYFTIYSFKMAEPDLIDKGINYKTGPVRTIREVLYEAEFQGLPVTVGTFKYRYYPYKVVGLGTNKTLSTDYGISLVRQSFDLNANAVGMLFNNPENVDIVVDGDGGVGSKSIYPSPEINWYMCSGEPGTFVMINEFTPPSGADYSLYYYDNKDANGSTADNTSDTGDRKAYGDTGILFTGSKLEGGFSLPYTTYFLPQNQPREVGEQIAGQYQNPMTVRYSSHGFTPPLEILASLPDTSAPAKSRIHIPVRIDDLQGQDITSTELTVQFDGQVLSAIGVQTENTLVENWDAPVLITDDNSITVTMSGTNALADAGTLVYLSFSIIGNENNETNLQFTHMQFNDGYPLAVTRDGHFTATPSQVVSVSVSDTTAAENSTVLYPILVDNLTGLGITSCTIELLFDENIVNPTSYTNENMLTEGWTDFTFQVKNGWLKITMAGDEPLSGESKLIGIYFDVIGEVDQRSDIIFELAQFNYGYPLTETHDGSITVIEPADPVVHVSVPDSTKPSLSSLHIPANVSPVTGYGVTSYVMSMRFDETVLEFKGVDISGSLTEGWDEPNVPTFDGGFTVIASGSTPLDGQGPLIYMEFDVSGDDGTSTDISFASMQMNGGAIETTTEDGTITVQGVVPVELAAFTANVEGNSVILEWQTATETNNFGFHIQRNNENTDQWERIGFVEGNGTTSVPHSYSYIDHAVDAGVWTYRLQQQDFDGQVSFSPEVEVRLEVPRKFTLNQNYPNPFNSSTTISYELPAGEHRVQLVVYDVLGHSVKTLVSRENQPAGTYRVSWDGSDEAGNVVPSGVYFYQLKSGNKNSVRKMVLIE